MLFYNMVCRFIPKIIVKSFYELSVLGVDYEEDQICCCPGHPSECNQPDCSTRYYVVSIERHDGRVIKVGFYCLKCFNEEFQRIHWWVRMILRFRFEFGDEEDYGLHRLYDQESNAGSINV